MTKSLLIGFKNRHSLKGCYFKNFNKLTEDSLDNYDQIFIYLPKELQDHEKVQLKSFLSKERLGDFFFSNKKIILIGSSVFEQNNFIIKDILGFHFEFKKETINKLNDPSYAPQGFRSYVSKIKDGNFFIKKFSTNHSNLGLKGRLEDHKEIHFSETPLVITDSSYTNCIKLDLFTPLSKQNRFKREHGSITILPRIKNFDDENYIIGLLKECMEGKNYIQTSEPDWHLNHLTVTQSKKLDEMQCAMEEKETLEVKINELCDQIGSEIKVQSVLWTKGEDLENSVSELFLEMGIKIEKAELEGREDLVYYFNKKEVLVIEVKGTSGQSLDIEGMRQLTDWKWDFENKGFIVKCLQIGNSSLTITPEDRTNPFHSDIEKYAVKHGYCYMTTITLFKWFNDYLTGNKSKEELLDKIKSSVGEIK